MEIREYIRLAAFVGYNKSWPLFRVGAARTQLSFSRVPTSLACGRVDCFSIPCIAADTVPPSASALDRRSRQPSRQRCRSGRAPPRRPQTP